MSIVYSAIVPHSPILIPSIGKNNLKLLKKTASAYEKIAAKLFEKKVDSILLLSPHGQSHENAFTINYSPDLTCDFKEFGDFSTVKTWPLDVGLAYQIKERLESEIPLQLSTQSEFDHGSAVPLFLLSEKLPQVRVIPMHPSGLDLKSHFEFGQKIKKTLRLSNKNIAVIVSGDLSHRLSKTAPGGYSPKGKKFDKKLIELLLKGAVKEIMDLSPELISEAGECGLKPILIQQGILSNIKTSIKSLSYESPFGVGYLVMEFDMIN